MLLNEFFGKAIDASKKVSPKKDDDKELGDELFWFILDHDKLHKDHFHRVAGKIKHLHNKNKLNRESMIQEFMPMVDRGCKEFYIKKQMKGGLGKHFPKEVRLGMCEKLYDHYTHDIIKDEYKIAEAAKKSKKTKENTNIGGGKMFGNTANKSQSGNAYTSSSHLRYDNGGVAE